MIILSIALDELRASRASGHSWYALMRASHMQNRTQFVYIWDIYTETFYTDDKSHSIDRYIEGLAALLLRIDIIRRIYLLQSTTQHDVDCTAIECFGVPPSRQPRPTPRQSHKLIYSKYEYTREMRIAIKYGKLNFRSSSLLFFCSST